MLSIPFFLSFFTGYLAISLGLLGFYVMSCCFLYGDGDVYRMFGWGPVFSWICFGRTCHMVEYVGTH